ncbi:MAG: GNAT family N-acetyltransferase [Tannerellaceae bacterium]|jgi:RimJ/RimL family protein N-acetyltransferase|nr:GNAT family N-acetyltransferase [Tannerellaceae bacterium]
MKTTIRHKLFTLRKWDASDAPSLAEHANDIVISRNVRDGFPHPYSINDATSYIEYLHISNTADLNFAIVINDKAVGGIGLVTFTDIERYGAELGYWLGTAFRGQGIMTEVVRTFTKYVLLNTNIVRLFASVFEFNRASARVLEKTGFRFIGTLRKAAFKDNRFVNMLYYEIIDEDISTLPF